MKILYVERKQNEYVSIEKVFRKIASSLPPGFEPSFHQLPYGLRPFDTIRNLLLFRRPAADIYHITGHVNYIALLFSPANTVLTIHDLRFLRLRSKFRKYILKKLYLDLPVRKLEFITAVSEFTKKEIVENTGCDPSKIRVLELPVLDHPAARSEKALFNKESPLLLQVGTMPNKNIERLIEAVSGSDCRLKIVGKLSKSQTSLIETSGVEYECVMGLCDDEMASEYRNADIVTFCSTYEGFGLPIIEAQAAGTPVITSNISPMTETSGGAAALADPFDTDSIRKTIQRVIEDGNYRNELIETGFKNAERFSADRIAAAYAHLYNEIACTNVGGAS